jgi:hypothetical protein
MAPLSGLMLMVSYLFCPIDDSGAKIKPEPMVITVVMLAATQVI